MTAPDLDVIKEIPGYKVILKAVVKSQIQTLVEQLAAHTDEESIILTASVADGTLSHIGSESGKGFLDDHEDVKSQFLGFCLKYHHKKKQQEREKERQEQEKLQQEKLQQMMSVPQYGASPGPGPRFMGSRSPRQYSPRYSTPRQMGPGRSPGMRHEPYPVGRPLRRPTPLNLEQRSPGQSGPVQRSSSLDGQQQIIKIEPGDSDEASNQSAKDSGTDQTGEGTTGATSSPSQNTPSNVKSESSGEKDDDAHSESSTGTIPNTPAEGLSLDSDLSNLISGGNSGGSDQPGAGAPGTSSSAGLDDEVNVKLEALTESEMELEITGVEPGRPVGQMPPDNWAAMGLNFDPTGATGSPIDMGGGGQQGYKSTMDMDDKEDIDGAEEVDEQLDGSLLNKSTKSKIGTKGDYSCGVCGKAFKHRTSLNRHTKSHDDRYEFYCSKCTVYFTTEEKLEIHKQQRHSTEFLCITCGKTFKQKTHLTDHTALMHNPEAHPSRVLICPIESCKKKFVKKIKFEYHMNVHTDVKPYACRKCNTKFHGKYRKNEHERVCLGLVALFCDQCGQDFTDATSRKRHMDSQHGGTVHTCVCRKIFKYYSSLFRHKKHTGH